MILDLICWYEWDDLHDLITYSLNILCMESVFSSMINRGWIWTWFWSKEKSFIWCLTRCYNTLYIFGKCGPAFTLGWFDLILRELELIGLISSLLSNLSLYGMVIFGIYWRFRLIFFWEFSACVFLRVLLTDRLRHPVWVLETPGLAYEEGKFLEDCLTKLLMFISTAHVDLCWYSHFMKKYSPK